MSIADLYTIPSEGTHLDVPTNYNATFNWNYGPERVAMMGLYQKGKDMQWDALNRIDWSLDLDEENPQELPEEMLAIAGADFYEKMSAKEKAQVRRHSQAWTTSQFMQGEQGALLCAAKIVQSVPDMDSKFYASTQVMDEARHVEAYKKLLEKFGVAYPMTKPLQTLIDQVLQDSRWDMTYLGMQVVIEGLALAAFAITRDNAQNPLAKQVNAYVMEDEARHVAFGRLALRDYYPQLTQAERNEREEFLVEACYLMCDRFEAREVWENLGLPVEKCVQYQIDSGVMQTFRTFLFMRIVPIVKDIGLWGDKVTKAYTDMGVIGFADQDVKTLQDEDERIARELDERREHVDGMIAKGRSASAAE